MRIRPLIAVVAIPVLAFCQPSWPSSNSSCWSTPPSTLSLGSAALNLSLTDGPDGYYVSDLNSATAGSFTFDATNLWALHFKEQGQDSVLVPADFGTVGVFCLGNCLFIRWRDPIGVAQQINVLARIQFLGDAFDFDILVDNRTGRALDEVHFPIISPRLLNPTALLGDILVSPLFGGLVTTNPHQAPPARFGNPTTAVGMQLFTLFDRVNGGQLTWHTKDPVGIRKDYCTAGTGTGIRFEVVQFPINNHLPGSDHLSLYSFTLTGLNGHWYEAARFYRQWALCQPWAQRGPLEVAQGCSNAVHQLKLHILQYPDHLIGFDDFPALVADAERVKNHLQLGAGEVALLWSDWHDKVFNVQMPDFLPARPSVAPAVLQAQAAGMRVLPYSHVNGWSPDSFNFTNLGVAPYVWTRADGTVPEILVGPTLPLLIYPHRRIDSTFSVARNARAAVVHEVMNALHPTVWDGIYLDTWTSTEIELDYNPFLYFKGGTPFWSFGRRLEANQMRSTAQCANPDAILTSEFPSEYVLDKVELTSYNPFEFNTIQLPMWETVYHGYVLNTSYSATVPQPTPQLLAGTLPIISYDFHLGKIIGLTNFFADARPFIDPDPQTNQGIELFDYLRSLMAVDTHGRKYRVFGERLRPLSASIERSLETLDYLFFGPPPASTSIWRASDGDLGIVATNHGTEPATLTLDVDFSDYGMVGSYDLFLNQGGVRIPFGRFTDSLSAPVPVGSRSALLLELVPVP